MLQRSLYEAYGKLCLGLSCTLVQRSGSCLRLVEAELPQYVVQTLVGCQKLVDSDRTVGIAAVAADCHVAGWSG